MKKLKSFLLVLMSLTLLLCSACANNGVTSNSDGKTESGTPDAKKTDKNKTGKDGTEQEVEVKVNEFIEFNKVSENVYKTELTANPVSGTIHCADPTAVEYNGRLYIYGSNDQQQADNSNKNSYEYIKSFVVFSTDDMVNWTYHGTINVGEIAPWIYNSWAPSICSRVEEDGLTHFYLYFSNSGAGVGVITSTDPVTGWTDPLGKPLVYQDMPGLENCPAPFDPGVCIDDNGVGWLSFGGGAPSDGTVHSYIPKIARLGADMLSFDSEFVSIDAPHFNEASELNYIDGTYYYTYCNDWWPRDNWAAEGYEGIPIPPTCSMSYMTTKTPLDADSWEYQGAYFYNAGENAEGSSGMVWSNNHTHFLEYQGVNYIIHHTNLLEELKKSEGGFRSLMVDYLPINEDGSLPLVAATRDGVDQIKLVDAYSEFAGASMFTAADIGFTEGANPNPVSLEGGAWTYIRGVDFGYGASAFTATVKGEGFIEIRLDDIDSEAIAKIEFNSDDYVTVTDDTVELFDGRNHNVYIIFSHPDIELASWQFTKADEELRPEESIESTEVKYETMTIMSQMENPYSGPQATLEMTEDGDYSLTTDEFDPFSHVLNLGFINPDADAVYDVYMKSVSLHTDDGIYEVPVEMALDPRSSSGNGLANGWGGLAIGDIVYGDENVGLVAAETNIDWIGYRLALMVNGAEVRYKAITYNFTVSNLTFDETKVEETLETPVATDYELEGYEKVEIEKTITSSDGTTYTIGSEADMPGWFTDIVSGATFLENKDAKFVMTLYTNKKAIGNYNIQFKNPAQDTDEPKPEGEVILSEDGRSLTWVVDVQTIIDVYQSHVDGGQAFEDACLCIWHDTAFDFVMSNAYFLVPNA